MLFDANIFLDVLLQRANAYPAARALTFAETDAVDGYVCASAFGVICHHGAASGPGRNERERQVARELMRFLHILPLTKEVLAAALDYELLSFEDAQVAAAGDLASVDTILTSDAGFLRKHESACAPRDLVSGLEEHLGGQYTCRVVRISPEGGSLQKEHSAWRFRTRPAAGARPFPWQAFRAGKRRSVSPGLVRKSDGLRLAADSKQSQHREHRRSDRFRMEITPSGIESGNSSSFPLGDPVRRFEAHVHLDRHGRIVGAAHVNNPPILLDAFDCRHPN